MPQRTNNGRITITKCFDEIIKQGKHLIELNIILKDMKESWNKREHTCPKGIEIQRLQDNVGYLKNGRESDKKILEEFDISIKRVESAVTGWKANLKLIGYVISSSGIFALIFSRLLER